LHVGHARTFLLAWWSARSQQQGLILRNEDLDAVRVDPELVSAAERDLHWLGLDWDGPSYLQSSGLPRLNGLVHRLLEAGLAYPCTCTRGDIRQAQSAPQQGVSEPRYPGTCRGRYGSLAQAERESGRPPGVRLLVEPGSVDFIDDFAGPQSFDVAGTVGDFLIARRDGAPAYQLAVVADDAFQSVTHIVRGDDLLASTARQILLQRALGLPQPRWSHVPLVTDAQGRRLAKRSADLSLAELRRRGVDPRALVRWVLTSLGTEVPELISAREALARFAWTRVPKSPVSFDQTELSTLTGNG
jgi:glutamyl-tRNA synthetase